MSRHLQKQPESRTVRSIDASTGDDGDLLFFQGNLIGGVDPTQDPDAPNPTIAWSGSLNEDDLWVAEPRNWLGHGLQALESRLEEIAGHASHHTTLLIVPHARHILNDAHGTRLFLDRWDHDLIRVGLALWPWGLFEPSMADHAEDHLQRILETLMPYADVLLIGNARLGHTPDDPVVAASLVDPDDPKPILPAATYLDLLHQFTTVARPDVRRCLWIGSDDESDLDANRDLLQRHSAD